MTFGNLIIYALIKIISCFLTLGRLKYITLPQCFICRLKVLIFALFFPNVLIHMQTNLFWLLSQFIPLATKKPITLIKKVPATQNCPLNKLHWKAKNKWALMCYNCRRITILYCYQDCTGTINKHVMHKLARPLTGVDKYN